MKRGFRPLIVPILVFSVIACAWTISVVNHAFDDDEFQHAHIAWAIHHNIMPYRDFFEHHIPLYHILLAPLFAVTSGPDTLFAFRAVNAIIGLAGLLFLFHFLRRKNGEGPALASVLLLAFTPMFLLKMTEARPEPAAVLCFILGFIVLFTPGQQEEYGNRRMLAAGFLAGISACFSQKFAFPSIGLLACGFILAGPRAGLRMLGGAVISVIPLSAWLCLHGIPGQFFHYVVVLNAHWKYRFSPGGYLYELFSTAGTFTALGLAGLAIVWSNTKNIPRQAIALSTLFLSAAAGIFLVPVPYRQAFLPLLVLLSVSAAAILEETVRFIRGKTAAWGIAAFIATALLPSFPGLADLRSFQPGPDLNTMRCVGNLIPSGNPVFDGRGLMFYRMHTGFYACMHHEILKMLDEEQYAQDTINALVENKYPVVLYDYRVKMMPQRILNFIAEHYCKTEGFYNRGGGDGTDVFLPGNFLDRSQLTGGCEFTIDVPGGYMVSWSGGEASIDGKPVTNGSLIELNSGNHTAQSNGFTDSFKVILRTRK